MSIDDFDEADEEALLGLELCHCGCPRSDHRDDTGRCLFCGECEGFELDADATVMAFIREDYL